MPGKKITFENGELVEDDDDVEGDREEEDDE